KLEKKIALVTGAASGIGRATALAFANEGASVVVADVDRKGSEETVAQIRQTGGTGVMIPCDVSSPKQIEDLVLATIAKYGRLDVAFNNAGMGGPMLPTAELSEE